MDWRQTGLAIAGVPATTAAAVSAVRSALIVVSETSRPLAVKIMILGAAKFNAGTEK